MRGSCNVELAHLKKERKKEEEKQLGRFAAVCWVLSQCFLTLLGVFLLVMKALEDERYVVIKAYKFTVFEILERF